MDKNAIKKYAVWARNELIARVTQKAQYYALSEEANPGDDIVNGIVLSSLEKTQRKAAIEHIKETNFTNVIEEVAYTWFNRFAALRYMEVNNLLPSRTKVFTDSNNNFKPLILDEVLQLNLEGLNMERVLEYKDKEDTEPLYKYLLITQCNALRKVLPLMFDPTDERYKSEENDYTQLLFPDNLLREGSVVEQLATSIPEEDWKDQIQIIGWLYQYYNTEPKDQVFANLKKNIKIDKDHIPAATQLFTPDWIVRYMVENSLGRMWIEGHPNPELRKTWKYYLDEAEQEPEVQNQLDEVHKEYSLLKPEDITCIDPCMGSGHILAYMFDVLMQIYTDHGYTPSDAVKSIIENNIYGLDIDDRAAQLAYFSVMMKASQYDARFLRRRSIPQPHVYSIKESNNIDQAALEYYCNGNPELQKAMDTIVTELHDAKEYGSLINVTPQNWDLLYNRFEEIENEQIKSMYSDNALQLKVLVEEAQVLSNKYAIVVTNPPYMGLSGMSAKLSKFLKDNYSNGKTDLFSSFMIHVNKLCKNHGVSSLITMESWMFLSSFEELREMICNERTIINMVHMPYLGKGGTSLGINFGTAAVVMLNMNIPEYSAQYEYTVYYECDEEGIPYTFPTINKRWKNAKLSDFNKLPGMPIAYWVSKNFISAFENSLLGNLVPVKKGMDTGDNNYFLKMWFEVNNQTIDFYNGQKKWIPYDKGGEFRRWYGNNDYILNWENDGFELKHSKANLRSEKLYFKDSITWNALSSSQTCFRNSIYHGAFDSAGSSLFPDSQDIYYYCGILNTKIVQCFLDVINPTLNYGAGSVANVPILVDENIKDIVNNLVKRNISISKMDWDSFETSWDFKSHPLINGHNLLSDSYSQWKEECNQRFNQLKSNEEELNRIFIDIYGLQDELTPEVEDKDVTVRLADQVSDIKSLISYAVGCMFGRYSLDQEGLAYAGGEWDESKYLTYPADKDNIIPICDDDYFDDDITGRFIKFIETVYGKETLEENLRFIADTLGGKGTPKEVIRNYFLNGFYANHCKTYQKRPIYWLFDSGKKNGFKALIYMHRYQPDTLARMRIDYVHEQQSRYRTVIDSLENQIETANGSDKVKLNKQLTKLKAQSEEIHIYEEKIHHLADQMISIDLDDGVKHNYEIFKDVLAKIK